MTSPLTNLAWTLSNHPQVEERIAWLVLMGGALDVEGNVQEEGHDGTAEWNIYWDPAAAKRVWDSQIPIRLFTLDATIQVPVTTEFRIAFGRQYRFDLSAAAGSIWAMTSGWEIAVGLGNPYFCWDTLATSSLVRPDLCTYREVRCDVVTTGSGEGRTMVTDSGRIVQAADVVDAEGFYAHVLETLRRQAHGRGADPGRRPGPDRHLGRSRGECRTVGRGRRRPGRPVPARGASAVSA